MTEKHHKDAVYNKSSLDEEKSAVRVCTSVLSINGICSFESMLAIITLAASRGSVMSGVCLSVRPYVTLSRLFPELNRARGACSM